MEASKIFEMNGDADKEHELIYIGAYMIAGVFAGWNLQKLNLGDSGTIRLQPVS